MQNTMDYAMEPRDIFAAARVKLMQRSRAFTMVAFHVRPKANPALACPLVIHDTLVIEYEPETVQSLGVEYLTDVLEHEFAHFMSRLEQRRS